LTIYNNDTATIVVTLNIDTSGTGKIFRKVTLAAGETYAMGDSTGGSSGGSGFTAATQAEQETGTSITVGVTPGRQQFHPSAAKAWILFTELTTTAIITSYNVSSVTDNGVGITTISFTNAFSSANYAFASGGIGSGGFIGFISVDTLATSTFKMKTFDSATNLYDFGTISLAFFGDQ
jgi:hypothetical protein